MRQLSPAVRKRPSDLAIGVNGCKPDYGVFVLRLHGDACLKAASAATESFTTRSRRPIITRLSTSLRVLLVMYLYWSMALRAMFSSIIFGLESRGSAGYRYGPGTFRAFKSSGFVLSACCASSTSIRRWPVIRYNSAMSSTRNPADGSSFMASR